MELWTYILSFALSLILSYTMVQALSCLFHHYNIVDNPEKYKKKRPPIPYSMGIVFILCFLPLSYFFVDFSYKLFLLWVFWIIISLVSFGDDMLGLSPKIRLCIQVLIGLTIGLTSIKIGYVSNIFGGIIDLDTWAFNILGKDIFLIPVFFTVAWYVFVFNALNWSDGIGGNTSGLSLICFLVIFLLGLKLYLTDDQSALKNNAEFIMQISLILAGILIPFFFFDYKEKILMWDSGTMFLAFMLASLAIISWGKIATVLAVFGIYAVDAVYVIVRRIIRWDNPMKGDFTHFHHRLQEIGFSHLHILMLIFFLSFFFGVSSLFLEKGGKIIVLCIIAICVVSLSHFGKYIASYKNPRDI